MTARCKTGGVTVVHDVRIIVTTHKSYRMPDDSMYLPLLVGADKNSADANFAKDNDGNNISADNYSFCELTGLYWAWKNLRADYIGLVHYRRHFKGRGKGDKFAKILTRAEIERYLNKSDVLLPAKRHYYIETNRSQYIHAHHAEGLTVTEEVIRSRCPEYASAWETVMKRRSGHRFNMFVMRYDLFCAYCEWLFGILFAVKESLDISEWTPSEQRVYGYLGERLLDVWLTHNSVKYTDVPYMFMEKQHWIKKIATFLKRKVKRS